MGFCSKVLVVCVLSLSVAVVVATDAHADLIVNGSFQDPDLPPGGTGVFRVVPGWTIGPRGSAPGYVLIVDRSYVVNGDGDQVLALLGSGGGWTVEQAVSTTAGGEHTLSFLHGKGGDWFRTTYLSCAVYLASDLSTPIAATGLLFAPQTSSPETSPMIPHSLTFTPTEDDIVIRFTDTASSRTFALLDKVVLTGPVSAVPEPTSLALVGLGAVGLGVYRRRRKHGSA